MENAESNKPSTSSQSDKEKSESKKYNFYRKPSIKKKVPEVKQTLTSLRRLMKANPLLKYEMEGTDLSVLNKQMQNLENGQNGTSSTSDKNNVGMGKQSLQANFRDGNFSTANHKNQSFRNSSKLLSRSLKKELGSTMPVSKQNLPKSATTSASTSQQSRGDYNPSSSRFVKSTKLENNLKLYNAKESKTALNKVIRNTCKKPTQDNPVCARSLTSIQKNESKKRKSISRSLSAQHWDRKQNFGNSNQQNFSKLQSTQSLEDISHLSPILESTEESIYVFKTPSAYERRSISMRTPKSALSSRRSLYRATTALPSLSELQKRLNAWLLKRGKSLSSFHHLQQLGETNENNVLIDEENKENIEVLQDLSKGSYEDLKIDNATACGNSNQQLGLNNENDENIAKAALEDLLKLIQDGYPGPQCADWLELIREKYQKLEEEPQYWECRAAIEQSRGNITNAVQCYRTAIIQGAEIKSIDESLDMLLHKFSLLNITTNELECEKSTKDRAKIVKDARNVFKSSIIQFAVQEKKLKKNSEIDGKKLIATPVRRSTRLSRAAYSSTPTVKICSSLQELDVSDRELLEFKKNKALV